MTSCRGLAACSAVLFLFSPAVSFGVTVVYAPTLPEGLLHYTVEAAADFAAGLGIEGNWYYNRPSLFGDVQTKINSPVTLAELIVYAAQSEADDAICLRMVETDVGWFAYALRWNRGAASGACRGVRDPENFDWRLLGGDLAEGRSPLPGDGEPDSLTGVRWFGHEIDDGLALVASQVWLEHHPENVTAALQLANRAGDVVRGIAVVGDLPGVEMLLDSVDALVGLAGEVAVGALENATNQGLIIALYFAGHAAENAWKVTRYAIPYRGIGDTPERVEALAERIALEADRYWELAAESYERAIESAGAAELGGSWLLMSRVALKLLYREIGEDWP